MRGIHVAAAAAAVLALAACGSGDGEVAEDVGGTVAETQAETDAQSETRAETQTETETETEVETETGTTTAPAPTTIEIVETSFDLSSPRVETEGEVLELGLDEPGTYTFRVVNEATIPHALAIRGPGVDAETGNIPGGQSEELTVTFEQPGEYDVWCPIGSHRELGMDGTIAVRGSPAETGTESRTAGSGYG